MVSILHLLGPDLSTGTAKQIRFLAEGLAGFGDTSKFCSLEHEQSRKSRLERFLPDVEYCRQSLALDPTIVVRCARRIRVSAPDIVHCWGRHNGTYVRLALRLAGVRHEIWSVRSLAEGRGLRRLHSQQSYVTNAAHLAISMSHVCSHAVCVSNGVLGMGQPTTIGPLHRELELSPETMFIAAVGDLRDKKRLKDVVWALDLLRVIQPHAHLLVLGEGEVDRDLRAFIASVASASAVHLLGFREDVPEVLRQCSCFWQASDDEGCSNAILEAMALGLPVIASDTAGHREHIGPRCVRFACEVGGLCGDGPKNKHHAERYECNVRAGAESQEICFRTFRDGPNDRKISSNLPVIGNAGFSRCLATPVRIVE